MPNDLDRRRFLQVAGTAALAAATMPLAALAAQKRRPNILVILVDDLGYADLGVYGCKDVPTPHMDSIAKNGVRFTDGYVSCPVCSPTRAGLLTGRYQQRFGHEFNPGPEAAANFGLPLDEVTLADRLKAAGYATGLVGKWHLGSTPDRVPQRRGFDEFFGFLGGAHPYLPGPGGKTRGVYRGTQEVDEQAYLTHAFAREAAAFVGRHRDHPFYLQVTFNAIHTPQQAPPKYLERFDAIKNPKRRAMAAMLSALDYAVGEVMGKLRAEKLEGDTLVFLISDNGGPTNGNGSRNDPFSGFKGQVREGGVRVPFMVQWKGVIPAGQTCAKPVISLDVVPTALAAAGVKAGAAAGASDDTATTAANAANEKTSTTTATTAGAAASTGKPAATGAAAMAVSAAKPLDGVNLLPLLEGKSGVAPHEFLFWRYGRQSAVRRGNWKLLRMDGTRSLFDLAADPAESSDLSAEKPEIAKQLADALDKWNAELKPPLWQNKPRAQGKAANAAKPAGRSARPGKMDAATTRPRAVRRARKAAQRKATTP